MEFLGSAEVQRQAIKTHYSRVSVVVWILDEMGLLLVTPCPGWQDEKIHRLKFEAQAQQHNRSAV